MDNAVQEQFYVDITQNFVVPGDQPVGTAGDVAASRFTTPESRQIALAAHVANSPDRFELSMRRTFTDPRKRKELMDGFVIWANKNFGLNSTDITPLLRTSFGSRIPFIINDETQFLNLMDMGGDGQQAFEVDDWAYRIRDRKQGGQRAKRMNPEAVLDQTPHQTVYRQKLNTLAFWGEPYQVSFVGRSMANSQGVNLDLLQKESDAMMRAIRQAKNFDYLNGVIQANHVPPNITVVGGLLSRIVTNTLDAGGLDISEPEIEQALKFIADQIGRYRTQCVLLTNDSQIGSVRTIELNRYSGENSASFYETEKMLAALFAQYRVQYDRIFDPDKGPKLPCLHEKDMPDDQTVIMSIDPEFMPREAKFMLDGVAGPWMFVRPVYDLYETVFMFDGGTLDDPAEETRVLISNNA